MTLLTIIMTPLTSLVPATLSVRLQPLASAQCQVPNGNLNERNLAFRGGLPLDIPGGGYSYWGTTAQMVALAYQVTAGGRPLAIADPDLCAADGACNYSYNVSFVAPTWKCGTMSPVNNLRQTGVDAQLWSFASDADTVNGDIEAQWSSPGSPNGTYGSVNCTVQSSMLEVSVNQTGGIQHFDATILRSAESGSKWYLASPGDDLPINVQQGMLSLHQAMTQILTGNIMIGHVAGSVACFP